MGVPKTLLPELVRNVYTNEILCPQAFARNDSPSAGEVVRTLCRQSLGGPAIGLAFALCLALWLRFARQDVFSHGGAMLAAAYGSYIVVRNEKNYTRPRKIGS